MISFFTSLLIHYEDNLFYEVISNIQSTRLLTSSNTGLRHTEPNLAPVRVPFSVQLPPPWRPLGYQLRSVLPLVLCKQMYQRNRTNCSLRKSCFSINSLFLNDGHQHILVTFSINDKLSVCQNSCYNPNCFYVINTYYFSALD